MSIWSPHPFSTYMSHHVWLRGGVPFISCIVVLCAYSVLDRLLPSTATYANIEYAMDEATLTRYISFYSPKQYLIMGCCAALHLMNTVLYVYTLVMGLAWCSHHLHTTSHHRWGQFADGLCWIQIIPFICYTIQHITIISQFYLDTVTSGAPQLIAATSITFLSIIVISVIFIIAIMIWKWIYHRHDKPSTNVEIALE